MTSSLLSPPPSTCLPVLSRTFPTTEAHVSDVGSHAVASVPPGSAEALISLAVGLPSFLLNTPYVFFCVILKRIFD